jgi:hypothetical protein
MNEILFCCGTTPNERSEAHPKRSHCHYLQACDQNMLIHLEKSKVITTGSMITAPLPLEEEVSLWTAGPGDLGAFSLVCPRPSERMVILRN